MQGAVLSLGYKEQARYQDLRAPIFRVQGEIIKEKIRGRHSTKYYITVRRIKFSEEQYFSLSKVFDEFHDGDEVAVEYSPYTKHVWKLYKTPDLT